MAWKRTPRQEEKRRLKKLQKVYKKEKKKGKIGRTSFSKWAKSFTSERKDTLRERARSVLQRLQDDLDFDASDYERILQKIETLVRRVGDAGKITVDELVRKLEGLVKKFEPASFTEYKNPLSFGFQKGQTI